MILKQAFNILTRLHSQAATLKRLGTPDAYSPIRITPSNYFRFLDSVSSTVVHGREFIIPVDTMTGEQTQVISFSAVPTSGEFFLTYNGNDSADILFSATASDVQTALNAVTGLSDVTVTGNFTSGFTVRFKNVSSPLLLVATKTIGSELDADITVAIGSGVLFSPLIKRGDKIIHQIYGSIAVDEIIEIPDIGGAIMGYRVRCE